MRTENETPAVRLADYRPPAWLIDSVALDFVLDPSDTRVTATLSVSPNPERDAESTPVLALDGKDLKFISASIDGKEIQPGDLAIGPEGLTVPANLLPDGPFEWKAVTSVAPESNTALEGLYMSNGMYCTQCEAQGFRKITWFPDRPDVMARYSVTISGKQPVLLSNGNLISSGEGQAEWHDPHPKPSYLFALVAGDLRAVEDSFTTASGREVLLQIWVRPGDEDRCAYAMDALRRSMRWDETEYGREYDLDRFMIVAVDDFNMGAMENKGLNIFNSKYVLASPETATDADFKAIEAIIAHEYFHNWTGNRITCRDWFQLSLKEGLTVFRDQQFSGDMRSRGVQRIEDVIRLRAAQFREDAGPLAHPVRPEEYMEINNFYTATIYEKGAELIGMLRRLVGPETYRAALDLYFERHDGQACTIEDWLKVFEDTSGRDLTQFARWYSQAGTPQLQVEEDWQDGTYTLTFSQETPPTPGQTGKQPVVIPFACGLIAPDGTEVAADILELTEARQSHSWTLDARPVPSLLRDFSAPVIVKRETPEGERPFLFAHDTNPFNKWEAGRAHALGLLTAISQDPTATVGEDWLSALRTVAGDDSLDPAFKALALGLPGESEVLSHMAAEGLTPDPDAIHAARIALERGVAEALSDRLQEIYDASTVPGPYTPDAAAAGKRALRARALGYLTALDKEALLAKEQFDSAGNMTESIGALTLLVRHGEGFEALAAFEDEWRHDRLVMDKWFAVQAAATPPEEAAAAVHHLAIHEDFDWKNPNRFRSLIGGFASGNTAGFHRADGSGYRLLADWLIRLDPVNPMTAARATTSFGSWRMLDESRQALARAELRRIAATEDLSKDTSEMVGRLLASGNPPG